MACTIPLAAAITAICERAGLPSSKIDVSLISGDLIGLPITNTYPAVEVLRALSQVFFFDIANFDGKIHFVPRGANSVATVTEADMLEDDDHIEQEKRGDPISIPRVLHINYQDVLGGLSPSKQTSERAGDRRAKGEQSLQSAVIMTADQAMRAVVINHKVMAERLGGELKWQLPDNWLDLAPSDPVIVQWQGHSVRAVLERVNVNDGFQEYLAVRDRQSAFTSNIEGIPTPSPTPPPSTVVGPTLIEALDIPLRRDADDNAGLIYYVAVSGVLVSWHGALVELSRDGGANYTESTTVTASVVMGSLLQVLPDHPQDFPDTINTVRVQIETLNGELEATDLAGLFNGLNLAVIGDELVQFANAEEVYEGVWDLSLFLRGRKATATAQHEIGERFVMLNSNAILTIPANLTDLGRTLTFRATSVGATTDTGTVTTMDYTGRSQTERAPSYVTARRDGSNAIVEWQGVGRLGGGANTVHGTRFDGYRVTFEDGVHAPIVVETFATSVTQNVSTLNSPVTIAVAQLNELTGDGPAVEVVIT